MLRNAFGCHTAFLPTMSALCALARLVRAVDVPKADVVFQSDHHRQRAEASSPEDLSEPV